MAKFYLDENLYGSYVPTMAQAAEQAEGVKLLAICGYAYETFPDLPIFIEGSCPFTFEVEAPDRREAWNKIYQVREAYNDLEEKREAEQEHEEAALQEVQEQGYIKDQKLINRLDRERREREAEKDRDRELQAESENS